MIFFRVGLDGLMFDVTIFLTGIKTHLQHLERLCVVPVSNSPLCIVTDGENIPKKQTMDQVDMILVFVSVSSILSVWIGVVHVKQGSNVRFRISSLCQRKAGTMS